MAGMAGIGWRLLDIIGNGWISFKNFRFVLNITGFEVNRNVSELSMKFVEVLTRICSKYDEISHTKLPDCTNGLSNFNQIVWH